MVAEFAVAGDEQDEEGAGAAGGVEPPGFFEFLFEDKLCVRRGVSKESLLLFLYLSEEVFGEPVGGVVFAEVVADFAGEEGVIELLKRSRLSSG